MPPCWFEYFQQIKKVRVHTLSTFLSTFVRDDVGQDFLDVLDKKTVIDNAAAVVIFTVKWNQKASGCRDESKSRFWRVTKPRNQL